MRTIQSILSLAVLSLCGGLLHTEAAPVGQPSITPEFSAVLRSGDVRRLRDALDHGSPANARDAQGNTPLMLAAVYADSACVKLLLDRGAEVNVSNAAGATPLMRAAFDYEKLRLLLERRADINAQSTLGNTALMLAARPANSHRAVELLLAHGANPNATNNWGATALMAAAASGDDTSVRLLLKHGANANAQPVVDHVAFIFGGGRSALMWAAYRGNTAIMKQLIDAGADVNGEGFLGTPLSQTAWANHTEAARFLIDRGAQVNQAGHGDGYTPLHWAASSEQRDASLVKLLLSRGADPNLGGGENVDAFMSVPQTPLMLARRRGETPILAALLAAGATNETPDRLPSLAAPARALPDRLDSATLRSAIGRALPPLQESSLQSKQAFVNHASHQDCISCHQQSLPLAAIGFAKRQQVKVDTDAERQLEELMHKGELKNIEADWQALFHPDPVQTKGYSLFGYAADGLPADEFTDSWVHHLSAIQGEDGRWFNNLPRPPLQTGDIGATALAIHALQRYPLPGRKAEFAKRVERARQWLWSVKPENNSGRVFQILGLAWAGEPARRLQPLAKALLAEQHSDGGWSQLPTLKSDAFATGQSVYALRIGAGIAGSHPALDHARRYLLQTQLDDGTWFVRRRAFPFQPTMKSGFPHGRDSWISAAATSWAVLALSLPEETKVTASATDAVARR
ncbi:MAG: ankyrin repeat domain-containing protein [Verrucomicrobia bacterium]|nr:ankyrin repeat domain-containing protein [Verrucomicrobiota bacterium]